MRFETAALDRSRHVLKIELLEIETHRSEIARDVRRLRANIDWDVSGVDQTAADTLILTEVAQAVEVL